MMRFLLYFMAVTGLAATSSAQTVWGIEAYSDVCRVVLVEDENRIGQGTIDHLDEGCRVGPFDRYAVGDRGEVRFLGASGDILMSVMPDGPGYEGYVGDGDPVTMSVMDRQTAGAILHQSDRALWHGPIAHRLASANRRLQTAYAITTPGNARRTTISVCRVAGSTFCPSRPEHG